MARDGSGTYTRVEGPYINGNVADADEVNNELDDISDAITDSINTAGTKAFGANQSMGGFQLRDLPAPSLSTDAARKGYVDSAITAAAQPLDATLTALAALSWSSGNALVQFTAADTVSLTLTPSVTTLSLPDGSAAAPSLKIGDEQNGLLSPAANQLGIALGGTQYALFTTTNVNFASFTQLLLNAGSASAPSLVVRGSDTNSGFYSIADDNWGFSLGGTKRIDFSTTLIDFSVAVRAKQAVSAETSGTLTVASSNKTIQATGNITIDGNVHTAGDFIFIYAGSASRTITQGSTGTPTQRLHGSTTTGNLTLSARGTACVFFISATEWVISGDVA